MSQFIIGLTGGIGSGKTTVANLFAELGIELVDADIIAREVVAINSNGLQQITAHFGNEILDNDGQLNRAKLREIIFTEEQQRLWLNNLLHPMIREQMIKRCHQATSAYVIMVVPLLFENGLDSLVNRTLVVDINENLQLSRTSIRDNVNEQQVANIIASQSSREYRLSKANDVISNNGKIEDLRRQVMELHNNYINLTKNNN